MCHWRQTWEHQKRRLCFCYVLVREGKPWKIVGSYPLCFGFFASSVASSAALRFNDIVFAVVSVLKCRNGMEKVRLEIYGAEADARSRRTRSDKAASHIHVVTSPKLKSDPW